MKSEFPKGKTPEQKTNTSKKMLKFHMEKAQTLFLSALDTHGLSVETLSLAMTGFTQTLLDLPKGTACRKSCSYCCHLRVGVSIPEAIVIFEQIKAGATDEEFKFLKLRVLDTAKKGNILNELWWLQSQTPCPFLDVRESNTCLIYELRPFSCRAYHSTDINACKTGFNKKETVQIPCFPLYRAFTDMYSSVFINTMSNKGLFSYQVGFISALSLLFEAQESIKSSKSSISENFTSNSIKPTHFIHNHLVTDWFNGEDVFIKAKLK